MRAAAPCHTTWIREGSAEVKGAGDYLRFSPSGPRPGNSGVTPRAANRRGAVPVRVPVEVGVAAGGAGTREGLGPLRVLARRVGRAAPERRALPRAPLDEEALPARRAADGLRR